MSLVVTVPLFFLTGVVMQRLLVSRLKPLTLTMMSVLLTFAVALIIEGALGFFFTGTQRRIPLPYASASLDFFGAQVPVVKLIAFGLAAVALALLFVLLKYTKFGQALRATIQHPEARANWSASTPTGSPATGSDSGSPRRRSAAPRSRSTPRSTRRCTGTRIGPLMAIIVVGGLGSIPGAAIAALVLGVAQSLLQLPLGPTWAQTVFYVALFATLMFRPQGFFGGRLAQRF